MSTPGTWGDWIVLWGLVNMLSVEVALVSSLGQIALRIIRPDSSKKSQDIGSMALLSWSWNRIPLSLFRAGGFYKVFPKCCRFLDRQVWRGKNNWRVLLRVREEIPERIIRYTCKWKRLLSVLSWRQDCVRPLPVHGNSPWWYALVLKSSYRCTKG